MTEAAEVKPEITGEETKSTKNPESTVAFVVSKSEEGGRNITV